MTKKFYESFKGTKLFDEYFISGVHVGEFDDHIGDTRIYVRIGGTLPEIQMKLWLMVLEDIFINYRIKLSEFYC